MKGEGCKKRKLKGEKRKERGKVKKHDKSAQKGDKKKNVNKRTEASKKN